MSPPQQLLKETKMPVIFPVKKLRKWRIDLKQVTLKVGFNFTSQVCNIKGLNDKITGTHICCNGIEISNRTHQHNAHVVKEIILARLPADIPSILPSLISDSNKSGKLSLMSKICFPSLMCPTI